MQKACAGQDKDRLVFGCAAGISFILILVYNCLTPRMSDDLLFDRSLYHTLGDFFRTVSETYLSWNGRAVPQFIMTVFYYLPKWVFNVGNSLCFIAVSLLIYANVSGRKKYDCLLYALIQLCLWNFSVEFAQTVLWQGGACNYLWGMLIILGFLTFYRRLLGKQEKGESPAYRLFPFLFLAGVLAGWENENTSGGLALILLLFTAAYTRGNATGKKRRIEKWMLTGLAGSFVGLTFLILAPGNAKRSAFYEEKHTGIAAYISRGLKIFKAVDDYLLVYLVLICFLGAWFYYRRRLASEKRMTINGFVEHYGVVAIFTFASLATAGVLVFTPEPMARAYFGANIYMMIAALNMLWKLREGDGAWYALRNGAILAGVLAFSFVYIEEGANLARILREVRERDAYAAEQLTLGSRDVALPMLRPQFESPYSYLHENDLSLDEEHWMNEVYRIYYGLDSITVLSREDWNEYVGIQE